MSRSHRWARVGSLAGGLVAATGTMLLVAPRDGLDVPAAGSGITLLLVVAAVVRGWPGVRRSSGLASALIGVVVALATTAAAVVSGWPGPGPVVLVAGAVLTTGTLGGRAALAAREGTRATSCGVVVAVGGVVVAVVAVVVSAPLITALPVITPAPGPAPTPASGVAWRWDAGAPVRAVLGAGATVLALRGDREIVALDAATGRVRWTHARVGTTVDDLAVSPDARSVVVSREPDGGALPVGDRVVEVLDTTTGAMRWSDLVAGRPQHLTADVLTLVPSAPGADRTGWVRTVDLDTGEEQWSVRPPPRCAFVGRIALLPVRDVVPVVQDCPGPLGGPARTRVVRAHDDSGRGVRWEAGPAPASRTRTDTPTLEAVTPGGRFLVLAGARVGPDVVEATTGAPASSLPGVVVEGALVSPVGAPVLDPRSGVGRAVPPCPDPHALVRAVADGEAATALCRDGAGVVVARAGAPAVPVDVAGTPLPEPDPGYTLAGRDGFLVATDTGVVAGASEADRTGVLVGLER